METIKNYSRSGGLKTVQKLMATVLFVMILIGCSKDDGLSGPSANKVTIKSMSPPSPSTLEFGEDVTITYDYEIGDPDGVRIWVQPFTNGSISSKYRYTASPLFKGKGAKTVKISVTSGDTTVVDQLSIEIAAGNGDDTISESFEAVNYTFTN